MTDIEIGIDTADERATASLYGRSKRHFTRNFLSHMLMTSDAVAIVGCGVFADLLLWRQPLFLPDFTKLACVACMLYVAISGFFGAYTISSTDNVFDRCRKSVVSWLLSILFIFVLVFSFDVSGKYSTEGLVVFIATGLPAVILINLGVARLIALRVNARSIAFVRTRVIALETDDTPRDGVWGPPPGVDLTGRHAIRISAPDFAEQCRQMRSVLQRAIAEGNCDQILLSAAWQDKIHIAMLLQELGPLSASIVLLPDPALLEVSQHRRIPLGDVLGFELQSAPLGPGARTAKRTLDIAVATIGIVLLCPVMLLAATAIWLESGSPILFRQDRRGFGGIPFKIMKFRSMTVTENGKDIAQAKRRDSRITVVGSVLRRSSIDELPQLFNVLKGEMSIVGPRPHAMAHDDYYDQFIENYAFRHHVKPGITGWAQTNGLRGATETPDAMRARIEHDLWYINHWSLWLDVKIILRTAFKVFSDDNAY